MRSCINVAERIAHCSLQDPTYGLSASRIGKLTEVFNHVDRVKEGFISQEALENYARNFGGKFIGEEELDALFKDFKPTGGPEPGTAVSLSDFLGFFAHLVRSVSNPKFEQLVADLLA